MNRRDFLKLTMYSTAAAGVSSPFASAFASHGGAHHRTLINVMCLGGADFRYLLTPSPNSTDYATKFWDARKALYNTQGDNYSSYQEAFAADYLETTGGPVNGFGIHKNAGWLKTQFDNNNVAIISNVVASTNRRHDQSQLIMNAGDLNTEKFLYDRDGWGGRLAETIGSANVVSMTNDISVFAQGRNANNRNANVIHARDTRNFALSKGDERLPFDATRVKIARSLQNYYKSKRNEISDKPDNWPYRKFIQHEQAMREFGDPFKVLTDANPLPAELEGLVVIEDNFKKQCQNIYDSYIGADLFKFRVASVEFAGWDTHQNQKIHFENNISDLFGTGKGLDTLTTSLDAEANNNTVFVFTTDFGRQLRANGTAGTDHGKANYMILIGPAVNGGVYGDMFPNSEIIGNPAPFDIQGADITGLTSFERVLGEVCNWVEPGSGTTVFPNTAFNDLTLFPDGPILESGVDLSTLFS